MPDIISIAMRVSEWLGLRPGERREAAFGFTVLLLVIGSHAMLETARDSLFLADLPAARLPWAYLTIAALALVLGTFNAQLARLPRSATLTALLVGGAIVDVGFWWVMHERRPSELFALYVWTGLIASLVTLQFWLLAGDVFDVGRAKRVFALVGAGGLAGATLGSAAAGLVVRVAHPRALMLCSAAGFTVAALVNHRWGHHVAQHGEGLPRGMGAVAQAPESLRRDPYLRRILLATLVGTVIATGVDYLFKSAVATNVAKHDLPSFLARYNTIVNASALVFQLVLAPRLLQGLGVVAALSVLPGLLLLGSAATAVVGGLVPALFLKAFDGTMRHSLDRAGNEILYLPLAASVRERFKALTTSVGQRGGQAVASIGILAAGLAGAPPAAIAAALAVLAAVWLASLASLRTHYIGRFRKQLRVLSTGLQGSLPPLDVRSLEVLLGALASTDDAEVIAALDMLDAYGKLDLVSPLLVHHPSRTVALRALALFAESPRPEVLRFVDRLLEHDDGEIRAAVLRLHIAIGPDETLLRRHLADPTSPAVRCTALLGLVAGGFVEEESEAAAALHQALTDLTVDACPILASALRDLPPRLAGRLASELSWNADPRFGVEVAKAIAAEPSPVFLDTLLELLVPRDARPHARDALAGLGDAALDRLATALEDPATAAPIRLHVPRSISRFGTARAAAILVERLGHETDARVTYKILRGLGRMRTDDPALPIDREALGAAAEAQLRRGVAMLAHRVAWDVLERGGLHAADGRAPLLPGLLDETAQRMVELVFRVLHTIDPRAGYAIAYRGLASADPAARANGRELAENLLQGRLRTAVVAITDTLAPPARLAAAVEFHQPEGADELLALASEATLDRRQLEALLDTLRASLLDDPDLVLRTIAMHQLDGAVWPTDAPARAGGAGV